MKPGDQSNLPVIKSQLQSYYLKEWHKHFSNALQCADNNDRQMVVSHVNIAMELGCSASLINSWQCLQAHLPLSVQQLEKLIELVPSPKSDEERLYLAHMHLLSNDYFNALVLYKSSEYSTSLSFYKGLAYFNNGYYDKARQCYNQYLEHHPLQPFAYYERGLTLLEKKQPKEAIDDFQTALMINSSHYEYHFQYAKAKINFGTNDNALDHLTRTINLNPEHYESFLLRGNLRVQTKLNEQALEDFTQAIEINPERAEAYAKRGSLYNNAYNDNTKAIDDLRKAVELITPNLPDGIKEEILLSRAKVNQDMKYHSQAINDYSKALEFSSGSHHLYISRGNSFFALQEYKKALADYKKSTEFWKNSAVSHYNIALAKENLGDKKGAIEAYTLSLIERKNDLRAITQRAILRAETDDWENAKKDFDLAIMINPKRAQTYNDLGNALSNRDEKEEAIKAYTHAIELEPEAYIFFNRGLCKEALKDSEGAIADANLAIQHNDQYAEAYNLKANNLAIQGKHKMAIIAFTKAIELEPDNAMYYCNRALSYSKNIDQLKALEDYNKAVELAPAYNRTYVNRGSLWVDMKDYTRAIQDCDKAIQKEPLNDIALFNRAISHFNLGNYSQAAKDYTMVISLLPFDYVAYHNRARAYAKLREREKALMDFDKCLEINPDYVETYAERAIFFEQLRLYDKAMQDFNMLIQLRPASSKYYNWRGLLFEQLNQLDEAMEDYNIAIELSPDISDPFINKGNIYRKKGDPIQALDCYSEAIEINPKDPVTYSNKGLIYYDMEIFHEALENFDQAIALNPELAHAYYSRALVYSQQNQEDKALEDFQQAIELDASYIDAYKEKGHLYFRLSKFKEAKEVMNQLIKVKPNLAYAYHFRSKINNALQLEDEAIEDAIKAFSLDPINHPLNS